VRTFLCAATAASHLLPAVEDLDLRSGLCRDDRHLLRFPRSFEDLQGLNVLLKKLKAGYPARIVVCWIATYIL